MGKCKSVNAQVLLFNAQAFRAVMEFTDRRLKCFWRCKCSTHRRFPVCSVLKRAPTTWLFCYDFFNSSCYRALQKLCTGLMYFFVIKIIIMETATVIFILKTFRKFTCKEKKAIHVWSFVFKKYLTTDLIMAIIHTEAMADPSTRIMTSYQLSH